MKMSSLIHLKKRHKNLIKIDNTVHKIGIHKLIFRLIMQI